MIHYCATLRIFEHLPLAKMTDLHCLSKGLKSTAGFNKLIDMYADHVDVKVDDAKVDDGALL